MLWTAPEDGADSVPRQGPIMIGLDRLIKPRTASRATVRLVSGSIQERLSVRFDPIDQIVIAAPFADAPLEPEVTYRLIVEDLRDLDDGLMDETFTIAFRTGRDPGPPYEPPEAGWSDVEPIFERGCSQAHCHSVDGPALGLDLSSPEGVRSTALGVVSGQLPGGTAGIEGARGALALSSLAIIDVAASGGRPQTSYLIYKVLGDPHILGDPMPPPDGPSAPLTQRELSLLASWILTGAPTR